MNRLAENSGAQPVSLRAVLPAGWWVRVSVLALLVAILYYSILGKLVFDWWTDPNYSHGFFVPAFSAFVVWRERDRLRKLEVKPSGLGGVVIAGSMGILILGVLGAELFLSRTSFVFLLAGFIIYFLGWNHFRFLLFPWACLFLAVPIPVIIFNHIAFPLQLLASRFASSILPSLGVPVLREGNILQLPALTLEVAEACSGIRSLVSLGTLAIIYGYFFETGTLRRVLLAVAAVPIAVVANGLRVVGTGLLVQYWDPSKGEGFFHTFEGWVIFVLSMTCLLLLHSAMNLAPHARPKVPS